MPNPARKMTMAGTLWEFWKSFHRDMAETTNTSPVTGLDRDLIVLSANFLA